MNITEIRKQYPQYNDISDDELAKGFHQKFYADMPFEDFSQKIGLQEKEKGFVESAIDAATSREALQMYGSALGGVGGAWGGPVGVAAGAGLGAGAGGQIYDAIHGMGTPQEQAGKAAKDVAIEGTMALVAPKVAQAGVDLTKKALSPMTKGVARAFTGTKGVGAQSADDIALMRELGLKDDASLLDNANLQMMGQELRNKPLTNTVMSKVDRHNYGVAQDKAEEIAKSLGGAETAEGAGEVLRASAIKNKDAFFKMADKLYSKVDSYLPDEIPVDNMVRNLKNLESLSFDEAEQKAIAKILSKVDDSGTITKKGRDELKRMASKAYQKPIKTDADLAIIEMRKGLGLDLDEAVRLGGGDEGVKALKSANKWWQKGTGSPKKGKIGVMQTYDEIIKQEEPAEAINKALANVGKKRSGSKRLERIMKATPEARGDLRAIAFRELGGGGEQFSFNKFLTGYQKLNPTAKKMLFGEAGQDIDKLKRVGEMFSSLEKKANFSNTERSRVWNELYEPIKKGFLLGGLGGGGASMDVGGALGGATLGGAVMGTGAAGNLLRAKAFTSPKFINWLANTSEKVLINPEKANIALQASRLLNSYGNEPEAEREAIADYVKQLGFATRTTKDEKGNVKKVEVE